MQSRFIRLWVSAALVLGTMPAPVFAQPQPAQTSAEDAETFSAEQLDSLLAPIALYPDALLTQTLMAATFPDDIAAAQAWLGTGANGTLKGDALETALRDASWDPSVKSLVPFPMVLDTLATQTQWTQQLGYAMQVQPDDVFDAVQRLRQQAEAAGNLRSGGQIVVSTEAPPAGASGPPPIVIAPANPAQVYVPVYNPATVYGTWRYRTPPVYYPPPRRYYAGPPVGAGIYFGAGVVVGAGLWGWARPNWGCCRGGGWHGRTIINVNINRWNRISVRRPWAYGPGGAWRPNRPVYRPGRPPIRPIGPVGPPLRPPGYRPPYRPPGQRPPGARPPGYRPPTQPPGGNRPGHGKPRPPPTQPPGGNEPGFGKPRPPPTKPPVRPPTTPPTQPPGKPGRPPGKPGSGNRPPNPGRPPGPGGGKPGQGNRPPNPGRPAGPGGGKPGQGNRPPPPGNGGPPGNG